MLSSIAEVRARGATVVLLAEDGDEESAAVADLRAGVPATPPLLSPIVGVVPLHSWPTVWPACTATIPTAPGTWPRW